MPNRNEKKIFAVTGITGQVGGVVARTLLADFSTRFAGDPSVAPADALARHLGL